MAKKMTFAPAGMESDSSDVDEMGYSLSSIENASKSVDNKKDDNEHVVPIPLNTPNGFIATSTPQNERKPNKFSQEYRYGESNRTNNRNRRLQERRHVVDTKSSELLDNLRFAVMRGNLEDVKCIISKGIYVDSILKAGWTALMHACSSGCYEVVQYLLENNADPNYHKDMFTPLMACCVTSKNENDLLKCVNLLLEHGARLDAQERHLTTALMFAVREGHLNITKTLIEHGALLDAEDSYGRTALSWAASSGFGQIVRLLIEKGADTKKLNNMGQAPLDLARAHGYNEIASLLENSSLIRSQVTSEDDKSLEFPSNNQSSEISLKWARPEKKQDKIVKHELEIFLTGLGHPELISIFHDQEISFYNLLNMNEEDLEKMGIDKVGVRNNILKALKTAHKKEWEKSSLPNLKQYQRISCPDAVAMVANIVKHLKYISCSVIYIRQQIQSTPRILELAESSASVHDLVDELEDSLKNVHFLNDELRFLKMHLNKVQNKGQYIPADVIVETVGPKNRRTAHLFLGIAISLTIGGVLWKRPNFLQSVVPNQVPFLKWK